MKNDPSDRQILGSPGSRSARQILLSAVRTPRSVVRRASIDVRPFGARGDRVGGYVHLYFYTTEHGSCMDLGRIQY